MTTTTTTTIIIIIIIVIIVIIIIIRALKSSVFSTVALIGESAVSFAAAWAGVTQRSPRRGVLNDSGCKGDQRNCK